MRGKNLLTVRKYSKIGLDSLNKRVKENKYSPWLMEDPWLRNSDQPQRRHGGAKKNQGSPQPLDDIRRVA